MTTKTFHIRMKHELLDAIKYRAQEEKRTTSEIIRQLISQYLNSNIYNPIKSIDEKLKIKYKP